MYFEAGRRYSETAEHSFTPAIFMRPHHFGLPYVRAALARRREPEMLALDHIADLSEGRGKSRSSAHYYIDVIGVTEEDREKFQSGLVRYYTQLKEVADDACIQLNVQPDGICMSCAVGRHCSATNYRALKEVENTVTTETKELKRIRHALEAAHFRHGEDFVVKQTALRLHDLAGARLETSGEGSVHTVIAESLIARVGALRTLC